MSRSLRLVVVWYGRGMQGSPPPPGFYDDGTDAGRQRWWDGSSWTDHWSNSVGSQLPAPAVDDEDEGISVTAGIGYILCFLIPFAAFFIGIALIARGDKHGIWVLLLSIVTFWAYVFLVLG